MYLCMEFSEKESNYDRKDRKIDVGGCHINSKKC